MGDKDLPSKDVIVSDTLLARNHHERLADEALRDFAVAIGQRRELNAATKLMLES